MLGAYEIAVFEALRERLRCKEIWVLGANRWRKPDADLAAVETRRVEHYAALSQPLDPAAFIDELRGESAGDRRRAVSARRRGIPASISAAGRRVLLLRSEGARAVMTPCIPYELPALATQSWGQRTPSMRPMKQPSEPPLFWS